MTTGQDLYKLFQQELDASYTGYYDTVKADRCFKKAYINVLQAIYNQRLDNQNAYDELSYLIVIDAVRNVINNTVFHKNIPVSSLTYVGNSVTVITELPHNLLAGDVFTPYNIGGTLTIPNLNGVGGTINTVINPTSFEYTASFSPSGAYYNGTGEIKTPNAYTDYLHLLYAECTLAWKRYYVLTGATNSAPVRIGFSERTPLRDKDLIRISGAAGNTSINADSYLLQLNDRLYALYSDQNLEFPVVGNGVYSGGGTVYEIITSPLRIKHPDQKGSVYGRPTPTTPFLQQGELVFKVLPDVPCETIKMDYIKIPPVWINTANNTIDYERYFPFYFIEKLAIEAARYFGFSSRDGALVQGMTEENIENP